MLRAPSYVTSASRLMVPSVTINRIADSRETEKLR